MKWSLILLFLMGQSCFIDCQLYEYLYINEAKTWTEAQQYCRENHTDLATVYNMTDMKRLLSTRAGYNRDAWIGLYDQRDGIRTWYWSLPEVEFNESETNWDQGEPNDHEGVTENCGILMSNLEWQNIPCELERPFLCYDETNRTQKYHLIREGKTWQEAQSYCREKHTDLISGMKQLQDGELEKVMSSTQIKTYFGLFRDTWRWSDGSSFSLRHWNDQLNNQQYNTGRCAVAGTDDEGRWKTESCDQRKPFICYDDKVILVKENKTWEDALNYCRCHYHDLVTLTSLDEQRWIQEKAKNASTDYVWIGLRYNCFKNMWFWVCKEIRFNRESQVSEEQMRNCDMSGAIDARGKHRWIQGNDTEELNFICSKV
ncbi:macrophage mannose receptor 1-like [Cyprinodon tularosa]|uniref:macrophage mannose receptor 1-like n=1 Tax=Cyprinodon tularosa TaxID=77115 RepID=UPI0018E26065|nr:macrophage mannose receptor 1-like [Cyprinodon tularosa]